MTRKGTETPLTGKNKKNVKVTLRQSSFPNQLNILGGTKESRTQTQRLRSRERGRQAEPHQHRQKQRSRDRRPP
jgi:hypothetical protein